jgi:hypothetical protein
MYGPLQPCSIAGLPATALTGLDFHQLDSFERFHSLIRNSPLPSFAWRDMLPTVTNGLQRLRSTQLSAATKTSGQNLPKSVF